jgi:hypothetical protein
MSACLIYIPLAEREGCIGSATQCLFRGRKSSPHIIHRFIVETVVEVRGPLLVLLAKPKHRRTCKGLHG